MGNIHFTRDTLYDNPVDREQVNVVHCMHVDNYHAEQPAYQGWQNRSSMQLVLGQ